MEITLPVSSLIIIAFGAIGVCIALSAGGIILSQKKNQDKSSYLLAALLLISGLTLLNETLTTSGITNRFKSLYFIPLNFSLSVAPLIYLFIKTKFTNKIARIDYLHLIIPLIQFVAFLGIGFQSIEFKSKLWSDSMFRMLLDIESILFPFGLLVYSFLSIRLLRKPTNNSFFWNKDLHTWLLRLSQVFIFIAVIELILFIGEYALNNRFPTAFYLLRALFFVSLIIWLAYNSIKLLYPISIFQSAPQKKVVDIDRTEAEQMQSKLDSLMETEKIYLNPDLNLNILSKYVERSEKNCSQFFSTVHKSNFNQYINAYRVQAFKEAINLGKHQNYTLISLAFESGFDSKSTFNRVFKQIEGITPSAYIKSLKEKH